MSKCFFSALFVLVFTPLSHGIVCDSFVAEKKITPKPGRIVLSRFDVLDREFTEIVFGEKALNDLERKRAKLLVTLGLNSSENLQVDFIFLPWTETYSQHPGKRMGTSSSFGLESYESLNVSVRPSKWRIFPERLTEFSIPARELWGMIMVSKGPEVANKLISADSSMRIEVNKFGVGRVSLFNVGDTPGRRDLLAGDGRASPQWIIKYRQWLAKIFKSSRFE